MANYPGVSPFQYQGYGNGKMRDSVNLQNGSLDFQLNLAQLTGRNNWTVLVSASYSSALALRTANISNETLPTGVLGLGWTLSVPAITAEASNFDQPEQRQYYISQGGASPQKLYFTQRPFPLGALPAGTAPAAGPITKTLRNTLLQKGVFVSANAQIAQTAGGFAIEDAASNQSLALSASAAGGYDILDGGLHFENEAYDFSRISYYPQYETWRIQNRDGSTDTYGAHDNARVFCVAYDGVEIPSIEQNGQQKTVGWALWESRNKWGDWVHFGYDSVLQEVGGSNYTKAMYLAKIENDIGFFALFRYGEKRFNQTQKEYLDPNKETPNNEPDAFQSRYQTRYLQSVASYSNRLGADGQPLLISEAFLNYDVVNYADGTEKTPGEFAKRLLTSMFLQTESGLGEAPLLMQYDDKGGHAPGAITQITWPEGGRTIYGYTRKDLGAWSQRSLTVQNPWGNAGYPKVWFGGDYAVVAWVSGHEVYVQIYTWVGRWQLFDFPELDHLTGVDPDTLTCHTQGDFAVLSYESDTAHEAVQIALHKNPRVTGGWLESTFTTDDTDQANVISGTNFWAVNDTENNAVTGYAWDALAQKWNASALPQPDLPVEQSTVFMASNKNTLLTYDYDMNNPAGSKRSLYQLWGVDPATNTLTLQAAQPDPDTQIYQDSSKELVRQHYALAGSAWGYATEEMTSLRPNSSVSWQQQIRRITETDGAYTLEPPYLTDYQGTVNGNVMFPAFFAPQVTDTGMVVSAGHMTRWDGSVYQQNSDLAPQTPYDNNGGAMVAASGDYAVGTFLNNGVQKTQVVAYDPDTGKFVTTPVYTGAPQGTNAGYVTASQDFLTVGNKIYNRGTSTDWSAPLHQAPMDTLAPDGNPASLINSAPGLFTYVDGAYISQGENEEPIFQADNTHFISLRNNTVYKDELVPGQQYSFGGGAGPQGGGGLSYYTYSSAQNERTGINAITLYRTIGDSVNDVVANWQVEDVTLDDGFEQTGFAFRYDTQTAAVDPSGTFVKYYQVDVFPNLTLSMEHGFTRYYYVNSLGNTQQNQNPTMPSAYDGMLKRGSIFNSQGEEVQYTDADYAFAYAVASTPTGPADWPIHGSYVAGGAVTKLKDGCLSELRFFCSPANGMTKQTRWDNEKIIGGTQKFTQTDVFAFEVYPALWEINDLISRAATKTIVDDVGREACFESRATTFAPWPCVDGRTVWDGKSEWVWEGTQGASDFDFTAERNPGWFELSRVTLRSLYGPVTEFENPISLPHAIIYDKWDFLPVARFHYARLASVAYCGFEDYEKTPGNNTNNAFTGIATGGAFNVPVALPNDVDYMLGWCSQSSGGWEYQFIKLPRGVQSACAPIGAVLDHAYISPFDAPPEITVYEGAAYKVGWETKGFGLTTRRIYDNYQRENGQVLIARCKDVRPYNLNSNYFSRVYGFEVSPEHPNLIATTVPQEDANYFRDYQPGCLNGYRNNYSAYINLPARLRATNLAFQIGSLTLAWQPGTGWQLDGTTQRALSAGVIQFPSTLMILVRKKLYVVADGKMIICSGIDPNGDYTISCSAQVGASLRDIVVGRNPLLSIAGHDGGAKLRQNTGVGDERWVVSETKYDSLAKSYLRTKAAYIKPQDIVTGYDQAFAQLDSYGGPMAGELPDFYPDDEGYPYTSTRYEDTPVGRNAELGLAGAQRAIVDWQHINWTARNGQRPRAENSPNHTERIWYRDILSLIPQMGLPTQKFAAATHFDPDDRPSIDLNNQMEQQAARITRGDESKAGLEGWDISRYWRDYYDDHTDNVAQMPNGYGTVDQFLRRDAITKLGLTVKSEEPNSGAKESVYSRPRLLPRLTQTEQQRADGIASYYKYDYFDRPTQEGVVAAGELLSGQGQAWADNPKFPTKSNDPAVYLVRLYGKDPAQPWNAARQIAVYIYEGKGESACRVSEEHFSYDPFGEIESYRVVTCGQDYTTKYRYNCQIKTIRLEYPSDAPYTVLYNYDDLGRVGSMDEINNNAAPRHLGAYDYTPHGAIALETLDLPELGLLRTTYRYNPPEWLVKIEGPDMTEEITYLSGGIDGKGYYAPKLARMHVVLTNPRTEGVKDELYLVEYDQAGRVSRAECLLDGVRKEDWSYLEKIKYDQNGNILTIDGDTMMLKAGTDQLIAQDRAGEDATGTGG
ncbi:MAG: hypothetical protein LBG83_05035 [Oscillospiraceae bacterium]|jgi:hypothetical protein|nr:hypothetical protein [Oscillospiraceae bacterium]